MDFSGSDLSIGFCTVNKKSHHIKKSGKPGNYKNDMQGFYIEIQLSIEFYCSWSINYYSLFVTYFATALTHKGFTLRQGIIV